MNPWQILGIEPTADERLIKQAYAKALKHNKPDKNPEGFKALRDAYEQALRTRYYYDQSDDYDDDDEFDDQEEQTLSQENALSSDELPVFIENNPQDSKSSQTIMALDTNQDKIDLTKTTVDIIGDDVTDDFQETILSVNDTISHNITGDHNIIDNGYTQIESPPDLPDINLLSADDLSAKWYDCVHADGADELSDNVIDARLFDILQGQLAHEFGQLTLDEKIEYEEYLIEFFYYRDEAFYKNSFALAFDALDWQTTLNSYKADRYPWCYISDTLERYRDYLPAFSTWDEFFVQLKNNYPTIYHYYNESTYQKGVIGFYVSLMIKSLRPLNLSNFQQALSQLHEKLLGQQRRLKHSNDNGFFQEVLQQHNYLILHKFAHLPNSKTNIAIWLFALPLLLALPVMFSIDHMGVISSYCVLALLLVFVLFWEKRWELFISPNKFIYHDDDTTPHLWRYFIASLPVVAVIVSYKAYRLDFIDDDFVTPFLSPSYYIAHFLGFWLWRSLLKNTETLNPEFIDEQWVRAFLLMSNALLLPVFALMTNTLENNDMVHYSPLFWVILGLPLALQTIINQQANPWGILVNFRNLILSLNQILQTIFMVFFGIYAFLFMVSGQFFLGAFMGFGLGLIIYSTKDKKDDNS